LADHEGSTIDNQLTHPLPRGGAALIQPQGHSFLYNAPAAPIY